MKFRTSIALALSLLATAPACAGGHFKIIKHTLPTPTPTPTPTPSGSVTYDTAVGLSVDANGFADLTMRAGAKAFYVSSSIGSDSNTCTQAQTASTPKATLNNAKACATDGAGDHLLMRQDDSFAAGLPALPLNGFSAAYPFTIESYDGADPTNQAKWGRATGSHRPVLNTGATVEQDFILGNPYSYVAVRGLDFNPGNIDGATINNVSAGTTPNNDILFENDVFRYTTLSFDYSGLGFNNQGDKLIIRNCALYGQYSLTNGPGSQGIYIANVNGATIEDTVLYHAGWKIGATRADVGTSGGATQYNHPLYMQSNANNVVSRRNAFIDGSADGGNIKGGGLSQLNFSLRNPIVNSAGSGNQYSIAKPFGSYIDISFNAALGSNIIQDNGLTGWGDTSNDGKASGSARVHHNIFARNDQTLSSAILFKSANGADPDYGDYLIPDNTVFDYNVAYLWSTSGGTPTTFTGGTAATAANNLWDGAASGSNANNGSTTFANAYTETTLLAALPGAYANETAAINDWINNPEQHGWRNATPLMLAGYGITQAQTDLKTDMRLTIGVKTSGLFVNTLDGYSLTASGLPTGVALDSGGRRWTYDGTGSATSGTATITESNGTNTHNSSVAWQVWAAPVLSSISVTPGTTTASVNVTTNVGSGKLYVVADTRSTTSYWAQIRAGYVQQSSSPAVTDGIAIASANQVVSASGAQSAVGLTGLTHAVTYKLQIIQVDANNNPSLVGTVSFTTT